MTAEAHVRFGSKADMCSAKRHVRFTPKADMNSLLRSTGFVSVRTLQRMKPGLNARAMRRSTAARGGPNRTLHKKIILHAKERSARSRRDTAGTLGQTGWIKTLKLLALPREAREVSRFNDLSKSLGRECLIAFQYVSASPPKPLSSSTGLTLGNAAPGPARAAAVSGG